MTQFVFFYYLFRNVYMTSLFCRYNLRSISSSATAVVKVGCIDY